MLVETPRRGLLLLQGSFLEIWDLSCWIVWKIISVYV